VRRNGDTAVRDTRVFGYDVAQQNRARVFFFLPMTMKSE
jgi:hypothetical protein